MITMITILKLIDAKRYELLDERCMNLSLSVFMIGFQAMGFQARKNKYITHLDQCMTHFCDQFQHRLFWCYIMAEIWPSLLLENS